MTFLSFTKTWLLISCKTGFPKKEQDQRKCRNTIVSERDRNRACLLKFSISCPVAVLIKPRTEAREAVLRVTHGPPVWHGFIPPLMDESVLPIPINITGDPFVHCSLPFNWGQNCCNICEPVATNCSPKLSSSHSTLQFIV